MDIENYVFEDLATKASIEPDCIELSACDDFIYTPVTLYREDVIVLAQYFKVTNDEVNNA
jgi:hypothetical protein